MPEVVAVRLMPANDAEHEHVDLIGYHSTHLKTEPIMIDPRRVKALTAVGERFWVTVDGQQAEIVVGECPVCGHAPYARTSADSGTVERLKDLPSK